MTRTTAFALAALFLLGAASVAAFAQDHQQGRMNGGMVENSEGSGGMMGGGMMGRGGMMGGMINRDMGDCCAGMMGGGMMGGMGHAQRPNQQWRHPAPKPLPDRG